MALSGCRARADRRALVAVLMIIGGCTTQAPEQASTTPQTPVAPKAGAAPAAATAYEAQVDLPDGRGRDVLVRSCLACHDLGGLDLFKGFYSRDNWRGLVLTMQANGAEVDADDVEVISDYLATYFGPAAR